MICICGICAIINFSGLTEKDLAYFTHTFKKSDLRGPMACGVGTQNLQVIKSLGKSSDFINTEAYKTFLRGAIGQKWIVGHTRYATQGPPAIMSNNHPLTRDANKFFVVHNGVVGSSSITEDPDVTDSYIIADAIKNSWDEGHLQNTVRKAYSQFWGFAATIAWTKNEICLTSAHNPIRRATLPNGSIVVASDTDYFPEGSKDTMFVNKDGGSVCFDTAGGKLVALVTQMERPSRIELHNWDEFVSDEVDEESKAFKQALSHKKSAQTSLFDLRKKVKVNEYIRGNERIPVNPTNVNEQRAHIVKLRASGKITRNVFEARMNNLYKPKHDEIYQPIDVAKINHSHFERKRRRIDDEGSWYYS